MAPLASQRHAGAVQYSGAKRRSLAAVEHTVTATRDFGPMAAVRCRAEVLDCRLLVFTCVGRRGGARGKTRTADDDVPTADVFCSYCLLDFQLASRSASLRPAMCKAPTLRSARVSLRMQEDSVAEAAEVWSCLPFPPFL